MDQEKMMWGIRLIRGLSVAIEFTALLLLLRMKDVASMLRLNGMLGLTGPVIFISVSALGLAAVAGQIPHWKLALILLGVVLVIVGTRPG